MPEPFGASIFEHILPPLDQNKAFTVFLKFIPVFHGRDRAVTTGAEQLAVIACVHFLAPVYNNIIRQI